MIPGLELLACQQLAVPMDVMEHVVRAESSFNPYAIGVVGARLERQPRTLDEAVATAAHLEREGYNFSLGLAQVNRYNLAPQGLDSYEKAFSACQNLAAGSRILADCHVRAGGHWGKAFSCYYSGNFVRGFRDGYVQKIQSSIQAAGGVNGLDTRAIPVSGNREATALGPGVASLRERRGRAVGPPTGPAEAMDTRPASGPSTRPGSDGLPPDGPFVPHVTGGYPPAPPPPVAAPAPAVGDRVADSAFVF